MRFVKVVELVWNDVVAAVPPANKQDTLNDWLQFHWELLVEWPLQLQYPGLTLQIYWEGAETSVLPAGHGRLLERDDLWW